MEGLSKWSKKRRNKNRPEEVSSKVPPRSNLKRHQPIDPRFDSAFGDFNEKAFNSTYDFVKAIKKREKFELIKQLKQEKDPEEIKKLRFLLTRIKNQEREKHKRDLKQKRIDEEKQKFVDAVFSGKKPTFPNKKEIVTEELIENFDELNKTGKLNKYIMKKQKKLSKHKKDFNEM